jgi:hypothetical protein
MGHPIDHYSKIKKELVPSDDPEVGEEISESRKPRQPEDQQVVRDLRQLGKRVLLVHAAVRHVVDEDDVEVAHDNDTVAQLLQRPRVVSDVERRADLGVHIVSVCTQYEQHRDKS